MKKVIKWSALVLMAALSIMCVAGIWMYHHPVQSMEVAGVVSEKVEYPQVSYTPYRWFRVPPKEADQRDQFNDGVYKVVQEKRDAYPKKCTISYDLKRHDKGGVTVTIFGTGTKRDGEQEEFSETLEFPITIEK